MCGVKIVILVILDFALYRSAHWGGTLQTNSTVHRQCSHGACHNSNLKASFLVDPKQKSIPRCWLHKINQSFYSPDSLPNGPLAICSPKGPVTDGVLKEWPDIYVMQRSMTSCLLLAKRSRAAESQCRGAVHSGTTAHLPALPRISLMLCFKAKFECLAFR